MHSWCRHASVNFKIKCRRVVILTLRPLYLGKTPSGTFWVGGCVVPRIRVDMVLKKNFDPPGNPGRLVRNSGYGRKLCFVRVWRSGVWHRVISEVVTIASEDCRHRRRVTCIQQWYDPEDHILNIYSRGILICQFCESVQVNSDCMTSLYALYLVQMSKILFVRRYECSSSDLCPVFVLRTTSYWLRAECGDDALGVTSRQTGATPVYVRELLISVSDSCVACGYIPAVCIVAVSVVCMSQQHALLGH
jgi:hypothetical protein